jgi:protoporphyrinogen oxidase
MGRFFPEVRFADVVGAASRPWGYNATFTYPVTGAVTYIDALRRDLDPNDLLLGEPVTAIDLAAKVATTTRRRIRYRHLVTSAPLPRTLAMCGVPVEPDTWSWNRVLVFNLGFDRKGPLRPGGETHWLYVARRDVPFYRVGFYDAITGGDRLSLYVEVGLPATGAIDGDGLRAACLAGLRTLGIVVDERLISEHHVLMDPAYVHLTPAGMAATSSALSMLSARQVHSIGRYGAWTYCSIEDNLLQARALVEGPLRVQG